MPSNIPLDTLQRWMQSVIEHNGNDAEAWRSDEAQKEIPYEEAYLNVLPSKTLSPVERIAIYRRMFVLRMVDSMAIDYPGVRHFLSEEKFKEIVLEYVGKYPSKSYTLNHLGKKFPQFIKESLLDQKEFLYDLAQLELALTENMDATQSPILTQEELSSVKPEDWERASLVPIAALTLMEFVYPVADYLRAVMDEEPTQNEIGIKKNWVVVYRKEYTTWFKQLMHEEYVLLNELCSGTPLSNAFDVLAQRFPQRQTELEKYVFEWFSDWVGRGMFSKILLSHNTK
ncbi:MAG: putative DNA-binding domain-containing protein [Ignavibacteriales bacterium]|nr:putative DNA-binding domain-containing protein [Ignavibacteriales bacterium]